MDQTRFERRPKQISISQSKRNNLILSKGLDFLTYHRGIAFVFTPRCTLWVKFLKSEPQQGGAGGLKN